MQKTIDSFFKSAPAPKSPNPNSIPKNFAVDDWLSDRPDIRVEYSKGGSNHSQFSSCGKSGLIGKEVVHGPFSEDEKKMNPEARSGKGWRHERLIDMNLAAGDRIVLVLNTDPLAQKNKIDEVVKRMEVELGDGWIFHEECKVYLYISSQRIAGCLVAEPISKAYKIIPCSTNRSSGSTRLKEAVSKPTKLQFGNVCFQREVSKQSPAGRSSTDLNMNFTGAMLCEEEAVRAVCGIRAISVSPSNRRKGIATCLLDAVRRSFCDDSVLEHSQLAFSQPTSAGRALASSFAGTDSFLVYKST
ncbi:CHROMOSOME TRANSMISSION FIDELITY 7-like protein [Drosera capensis]